MRRSAQLALRALFVVLVLGVGIAVLLVLVKTRPEPEKKDRTERGALVEVTKVESSRQKLKIQAQGSVIPARQVVIQPEITGRVIWQHDDLVPGGRFKKGETLVKIDARDYALAAKQQHANVERARQELALEKSRGEIAKGEWAIIGEDLSATKEGKQVALRKPQLQSAKASLEAAKSARDQARLAVSRSVIKAPFNGFVKDESVDTGQLVSPASRLATLVGSDSFWVQVSIPVEKLEWMSVPGLNAKADEGSSVVVWQDVGGRRVERTGRVMRLLGDLDPVGSMARLLVEIQDPLGKSFAKKNGAGKKDADAEGAKAKSDGDDQELPILLGAFVQVGIEARQIADVIEVPRLALREDDSVYVYSNGKLQIRDVSVVWRRESSVLISKGLKSGDEVIVSRLPNAVPGMKLRKLGDTAGATKLGKR